MKRGVNACQTHHSMYPSIFNRFPVIQPISSKVHHFSTFLYILASSEYAPGTITVNVTGMERGFNAGQMHSSISSTYLQLLTSYSEILVGNCNFFVHPCIQRPRWECSYWNSGKKFGPQKTRIMELPGSKDSLTIGWAVLTQYQRVTDRQMSSIYQ